jgi:hypothetical protein
MKVYDIVNEAKSIGKGEYAGFVWDQPTGSSRITVTFPDGRTTTVTNRDDAKKVADNWIAKSSGKPIETDDEKKNKAKKAQYDKFYRYLRNSTITLHGILSAVSLGKLIYDHVDVQMEIYKEYHKGTYGTFGTPEAIAEYEEVSNRAYGIWVSQTAAAVVTALGHAAVSAALIRKIRLAIAAGAIATTGPFGAIAAFLAGEAISYGVIWFLSKKSTIYTLIEYTWDLPGLIRQAVRGSFTAASSLNPDIQIGQDVKTNLRQAINMDPKKTSGDIKGAQDYKTPAPGSQTPPPASASAGTPPTAQVPPTAAPAAGNPFNID